MPKSKPEAPDSAFKHLFNDKHLERLAKAIGAVYPKFDAKSFRGLMPKLEKLEMKPRVRLIRDELEDQLPDDYAEALTILLASIEKAKLQDFDLWPYTEFIQAYGLQEVKLSLDALRTITKLFTAEFAIRPFLIAAPKVTLAYLEKCAKDPSVDLRRWASEGTRPRLPWGERLQEFIKDPSQAMPILERLKFDDELYVRKSVSNHLNDIAKDHPEFVIKTLARWKKEAGEKNSQKIEWIIRRSLRTLIKDGHAGALKLIGVSTDAKVQLKAFKLNQKSYRLGDRMEFQFRVESEAAKPQKLVVDYLIHFVKANGKLSPKVFKLKTFTLPGKEMVTIEKSHHLKKVTTRVFYAGNHVLEIQVNGRVLEKIGFELKL
jgi:3-methyladenine DNA glycosylase AlkC